MPEAQRIKTKVCLVGEAAVGKTSLIRRFVQDEFDDRYITTLGAKVSKREMAFEAQERTKIHMDMTVWEIMGEKGCRDVVKEAFCHTATRRSRTPCGRSRRRTFTPRRRRARTWRSSSVASGPWSSNGRASRSRRESTERTARESLSSQRRSRAAVPGGGIRRGRGEWGMGLP